MSAFVDVFIICFLLKMVTMDKMASKQDCQSVLKYGAKFVYKP